MPTKTPFAGLERLGPGEPLSSDGYAFQDFDRATIDRILRVGAVTHHHNGHPAMANPVTPLTAAMSASGGSIPANMSLAICYTLLDADNGETIASPAAVVSTSTNYVDPFDAPNAAIDYTAGSLLAGDYSYAITVTDGAGGETAIGPSTDVTIDPGHTNAEVHISGLSLAANDASNSDPAAGWRLWRVQGGGPWYLIASNSAATDTYTDAGALGDCTIQPPLTSTVRGASSLSITVPSSGQPSGVTSFNVYVSLDGSFTSPALLGNYLIANFDTPIVVPDLSIVTGGSPPTVSTALPGANQINPDTDIVNWHWKAPVANAAALPLTGNGSGDTRVTLDTFLIWFWDSTANIWRQWNPGGGVLTASQQSANYTLVQSDANTVIEFTGGGAVTLTIPAHVVVALPVGCVIEVFQYGAGQVTVAGGSGVTLRSDGAKVHTAAQYATISMRQRATDEWVLSGDLA